MRVWEFEDKKETPSDLVREQDFILRVRRMQRVGGACLVLNFILDAIEPLVASASALEEAQKKLRDYATSSKGAYFEMSNGDVFIVWENPGAAQLISERAIDAALDAYRDNTKLFLLTYRLPENYTLLRERANYYVETVRARAVVGGGEKTDKVDESSGHLTAKNVDQIEHLLGAADVRRYGRTQGIYRDNKGVLEAIAEEYFFSLEDLRRELFPKLEIERSEHFFFAICSLLDQKLLSALTTSFELIEGRAINLNLSIASIMSSIFAQFVRRVPMAQRGKIGFELNGGELLQDFSLTLSAIMMLKREGFHVALDHLTPNMAGYINLDHFNVDSIKINVSKDGVQQLADPLVYRELKRLPPEKLIFFRCDNDRALAIGREIGVSIFQGWLIDDLAAKKN